MSLRNYIKIKGTLGILGLSIIRILTFIKITTSYKGGIK